jgi:hypothetical protein
VVNGERVKLSQRKLARALGISPAMVTKHKQIGMPTHSIGAACEWRRRNLDPGLVKNARQPIYCAPVGRSLTSSRPADNLDREQRRMLRLIFDFVAWRASEDFATWGGPLRYVMRGLPESMRGEVGLAWATWEALVGKEVVERLRRPNEYDNETGPLKPGVPADVGAAMYGLACGELVLRPEPSSVSNDGS